MDEASNLPERKGVRVRPTVENWLGHWVAISYMAGPKIDENNVPDVDEMIEGQPVCRNEVLLPIRYDPHGITVVRPGEDESESFISWGAVMTINGPTQEKIEQIERDRERQDAEGTEPPQLEQTGQPGPSVDRQELMDLLANASTATQVAVARGAAESYLASDPSDGDVRAALDQLPDPTGD